MVEIPDLRAFVLVTLDGDPDGLAQLVKQPMVKEAWLVAGIHDAVLVVDAEDIDNLQDMLINQLRSTPGIAKTVTSIGLNQLK